MYIDPENNVGFSWTQKWFHPRFWWLFTASASKHDDAYSVGGTREDRLKADIGFFWRIVEDTKMIEDWKIRRRAVNTAIFYYKLVRLFGWLAFNRKK